MRPTRRRALLAALGVLATSTRPRRGPAWRLPALLAVPVALAGVLWYHGGLVPVFPTGEGRFDILFVAAPLARALPVAVWTISAIRGRPPSPRRTALHVLVAPLLFATGVLDVQGRAARR